MPDYNNKADLMAALSPLSPSGRAEILYKNGNRNLAVSYGANVTFYYGKLAQGNSFANRLANVFLTLIKRTNPSKGPDGLGALGGRTDLSRHSLDYVNHLPLAEQITEVAASDNLSWTEVGSIAELTEPLHITKKTVMREMREELQELGIDFKSFGFDPRKLNHLNLPIKDDNYILARWNGDAKKGQTVTAVDPFCYSYQLLGDLITKLPRNIEKSQAGEVGDFATLNLFEALQRFGKPGETDKSEDGRDLDHDYRYPHEYLITWKIASELIRNSPHKAAKMVNLAQEVQQAIYAKGNGYKIDFKKLAEIMKVSLDDIDQALSLPAGTIAVMQEAIDKAKQKPGKSPAG